MRRRDSERAHLRDDRRGVSVTVSHALTITITAVLMTGLVIAASGALAEQRHRAAESQLSTIGQRLAFELERAASLAATGESTTVTLLTDHTARVVGGSYRVTLTSDAAVCVSPPCLAFRMDDPEVSLTVSVTPELPIQESTASGGRIRIVYDGTLRLEGV
ncbi:DUF7266 family protein [Halobaculum sp. P14]|uniref:DUF7266 family protein n=1 Tax=Halobaculum sp. P14 TaxID=3421638 RepID=UPI003EBE19F7